MLLSFKSGSSVDSVISVIVKTVFVLMLPFDSFSNDRELSLDDKTKDYVNRNTGGQVTYSCKLNFVT